MTDFGQLNECELDLCLRRTKTLYKKCIQYAKSAFMPERVKLLRENINALNEAIKKSQPPYSPELELIVNKIALLRARLEQEILSKRRGVFGDGHGNTTRILTEYSLFGAIQLNSEQEFEQFIRESRRTLTSKQAVSKIDFLLANANYDPTCSILAMGDNTGDRAGEEGAGNDLITLKLYRSLLEHGVEYHEIASNHGLEIFKLYWSWIEEARWQEAHPDGEPYPYPYEESTDASPVQAGMKDTRPLMKKNLRASLVNLKTYYESHPEEQDHIKELIEMHATRIKLLDAHVENDGSVVIYSHAPIDLKIIDKLCRRFVEGYYPEMLDSAHTLLSCIAAINQKFQALLVTGEYFLEPTYQRTQQLSRACRKSKAYPPERIDPIVECLLNRTVPSFNRSLSTLFASVAPSLDVKFVFGHVGESFVYNHPGYLSLDTNVGKMCSSPSGRTKYFEKGVVRILQHRHDQTLEALMKQRLYLEKNSICNEDLSLQEDSGTSFSDTSSIGSLEACSF